MEESQPGPGLTATQAELVAALSRIEPRLREMYLGACSVLQHIENPDRFAMCAHSLRELMEKLPRYLDVPMNVEHPNTQPVMLNGKVRDVYSKWAGWKNGKSRGEVADASYPARLRRAINKFFEWYATEIPRGQEATAKFLAFLDPAGQPPPAAIELRASDEWKEIRDALTGIAHHRTVAGEQQLRVWTHRLDGFLVARLHPRTFENFTRLDQLIEEGESDANG